MQTGVWRWVRSRMLVLLVTAAVLAALAGMLLPALNQAREKARRVGGRGDWWPGVRNTETYDARTDNSFRRVSDEPLSTFGIDVDTASYSNVRRFVEQWGQLPPPAAVREEEMINYFSYTYPLPEGSVPLSVSTELATCPWQPDHQLLRIGLRGREVRGQRPPANLVLLKDSTLERLTDQGNGNYAYIDSAAEARKVLAAQLDATLVTIAKDVKIQVEFNPAAVQAYRLIGYENRMLAHEHFRDDRRDAGDIGAGHRVTALYEIVPPGVSLDIPPLRPLRYQHRGQPTSAATVCGELATICLRYKAPDAQQAQEVRHAVIDECRSWGEADIDFRFASVVAAFGMVLAESEYCPGLSLEAIAGLARACVPPEAPPRRRNFLRLCERAASLAGPHLVTD